eukprot:CAMPEP_0174325500 /NCGR_PEP_ID=MMETSP0810-20121108/13285_1 /TAXON_ID=73025 ORGANISM="Eutreptiella gymnastica-like, Strain CCMP1594" /NCGR_SAMPLE_ID=MMETSP0810 /ASSEMBLY_ACC=CAM_ASM_000659 /LENGTH=88 /DNA_ID=CAMNT_0015438821 /DNA_START=1148 /DNA_END=1412 /DNA_ORIENTATION=-
MTWGLYGQFGLKVELDTKLTVLITGYITTWVVQGAGAGADQDIHEGCIRLHLGTQRPRVRLMCRWVMWDLSGRNTLVSHKRDLEGAGH